MKRLLLLFLVALPLSAQNTVEIGAAVGEQSYRSAADNPRVLTSLDLLLRRDRLGFDVAAEYADLTDEGALFVVHPDVVYRYPFTPRFAALIGAGLTYSYPGGSGGGTTWNALLELEYRWGRAAVFARVRQYDYELQRFREGDVGPTSAAVYVGARYTLRRQPG